MRPIDADAFIEYIEEALEVNKHEDYITALAKGIIHDLKDEKSTPTLNVRVVAENATGDTIYRRAAIEHFKRIIESTNTHGEEYNEGFNAGLEFCISHISTMPPAEQRTGRWVEKPHKHMLPYEAGTEEWDDPTYDPKDHSVIKMHLHCSECDFDYGENDGFIKGEYKYCRECGAKIEG